MKKKPDNLKEFLDIRNQTSTSADLYFYGDIVSDWWGAWSEEDQYPDAVKNFLNDAKDKELNIYINSGGGSVFAGMAIYNMLKRHKGFKTVYVDGIAASIASVIALAGDKVVIPSNAYFMIHKPWSWTAGNSDELRQLADSLDVIEEGILNVYKDHLKDGVEIETIKEMVANETWLVGSQASEYFNIETSEAVDAVAYTNNSFKNAPKTLNFKNISEEKVKNKQQIELAQAKLELLKRKVV